MKRFAIVLLLMVAVAGLWLLFSGGSDADAAEPQADSEASIETSDQPEQAGAPQSPAVEVRVAEARVLGVDAVLWVPGTVVSRHDAEIASEVAGPLVAVAEVGDAVKTGEVLARVDDAALRLRLRSDEAEIRRLEAHAEYLDRQLERVGALNREQIATRTQLDELTSERAMSAQTLESARVDRDTTSFLIERSVLRAPFPGRVVARLAQPGGYVSVGQSVVRLVDTGHVEVRAQAPLQSAARIREGMELKVEGPVDTGSSTSVGTVRAAVPVGDERSRMFELRVVPDGRTGAWPVGVPVRVGLPAARSGAGATAGGAVSVPRDALVLRRDATYVFVVGADETARRVVVEPGAGDGERIEVVGDLRRGDRVVIRGAERLDDGARVRITG